MRLTVEIPYLGPIEVDAPRVSAGSSGAGAMILGAAGSVVPGAGTALGATIGSIVEQLAGMVKGRTQTFDWNTSNEYSVKLAKGLAEQVQAAKSKADFDRLAVGYPAFVSNYIRSAGYWSQKRAEEVSEVLLSSKAGYDLAHKSAFEQIRVPLWELSMWILTQSDKNRPEELPKFFKTHLEAAYGRYWFPDQSSVSVELPAVTQQQAPPSQQALQVTTEEGAAYRTYLLIGGAAILVVVTLVAIFRR